MQDSGNALGDWRIDVVLEMRRAARPPATMLPDWDPRVMHGQDWLQPDHIDPATGCYVASIGGWLLRGHGRTILLDTGAGASKPRPLHPSYDRQPSRFLPALARLGPAPEDVDTVVLSHLHVDHAGGTTIADGPSWRPLYPRARHLVPRAELEDFERRAAAGAGDDAAILMDSVAPLLAAGLLDAVETPTTIAPGVTLELAPGHTLGHAMVRVEGATAEALVTFDVMHSVLQVLRPDWNTMFCEHPDLARATRHRVLAEAAARGLLLYPTHFAHAGPFRVVAEADGYRPVFTHATRAAA